jgi:hypothetical protein
VSVQAPRRTRARLITSVGLGAMVALSATGQALALTTYTDPVGDALFNAPAYLDVVSGTASESAGIFEFTLTVADAIPATPRFTAPGVQGLRWVVSFELDPTTHPQGWPAPPGQAPGAEGFISIAWDGHAFTGTFYDRRPLLTGGEVLATSVPFQIDGDTVRVWLDASLIGNPSTFRLGFVTVALTTKLGTKVDIKQLLDVLEPFYNPWP